MSFWKDNPFSPSWTNSLQTWWSSSPPKLLVSQPRQIPLTQIPGLQLSKGTEKDISALCEFWRRYFSVNSSAICQIPPATVLKGISDGNWEIWIAVEIGSGEIKGTIVRKWIKSLTVDSTKFQKAAMIDFFCVHPAWRNKGLGRFLLQVLHNTSFTATRSSVLPPHLILWEGISPTFPPAAWGLFWAKRCKKETNIFTLCKKEVAEGLWNGLSGRIKTSFEGNEIVCYRSPAVLGERSEKIAEQSVNDRSPAVLGERSEKIAEQSVNDRSPAALGERSDAHTIFIWNTYHKSPEGGWIGIVISATSSKCINDFSREKTPFSILLASRSLASGEGWEADSPFQFIIYNCSYSSCLQQEFPLIGL